MNHGRIHRPPDSVHDPDPARHHAGVVRRRAICAGRTGRARHRPTFRAPTPAHRRASQARPAATSVHAARRALRSSTPSNSASIAARRVLTLNSSSGSKHNSVSTSRPMCGSASCCGTIAVRFRQKLLPRRQRDGAHQGKAAGVDVARHLDDAAANLISIPLGIRKAVNGTARVSTYGPPASSSSAMPFRDSCSPSC